MFWPCPISAVYILPRLKLSWRDSGRAADQTASRSWPSLWPCFSPFLVHFPLPSHAHPAIQAIRLTLLFRMPPVIPGGYSASDLAAEKERANSSQYGRGKWRKTYEKQHKISLSRFRRDEIQMIMGVMMAKSPRGRQRRQLRRPQPVFSNLLHFPCLRLHLSPHHQVGDKVHWCGAFLRVLLKVCKLICMMKPCALNFLYLANIKPCIQNPTSFNTKS